MIFAAGMRFLILGGTAWLVGHAASTALALGHQVTCLARGSSGDAPVGAEFVHADRTQPGAYDHIAGEQWDVVIDVSRQPGQVKGAVAALADRTGFFVFVSSGNVYADHSTPGQDEGGALLPALTGDVMESMEAFGPDRALIARAGLIGGPGDIFDRTGYWPLRFARPATEDGAVMVPDAPDLPTQMIDVRDLAACLVDAGNRSLPGIFNATGETVLLPGHLDVARTVGGHTGPVVAANSGSSPRVSRSGWASGPYPCGSPTPTGGASMPTTAARNDAPGSPPVPWTRPWPTPSPGRCLENAPPHAKPAYPTRTSEPCSRPWHTPDAPTRRSVPSRCASQPRWCAVGGSSCGTTVGRLDWGSGDGGGMPGRGA